MMPAWPHVAYLFFAYLVGGLSPGYWLVRLRRKIDVRTVGSGATGATNVGRVLGRGAAALVLGLDLAKGALVAGAAVGLSIPAAWAFAAVVAVVAGHIWPVWLGFRGGKGVGPFLGSWLVLAPLALVPCIGLGLICFAWLRRVSISGLCGLVLLPAAVWWTAGSRVAVAAACATLSLLLWSHRANLRAFAVERQRAASAPATPTNTP